MLEKNISSERGKTYYWTEKRNSPFSLVFLPGLTANHQLFDRQIEVFSEQYDIIEGAAHNANDDQPKRVNELLNTFLQAL